MELFLPDKEYFSIGEVAKITGLPAHTIRYWESEFSILKPIRKASRHRKYTNKDIQKIKRIQELLHKNKYTIEGAKKVLLKESREKLHQLNLELERASPSVAILKEIKKEVIEVLDKLKE